MIIISRSNIDIIFNPNSDFYNNLRSTLTDENGVDKPLKPRQIEFIDNNMSVCEEDCHLKEYEDNEKKVKCSWYTKINLPLISEIKIQKFISK